MIKRTAASLSIRPVCLRHCHTGPLLRRSGPKTREADRAAGWNDDFALLVRAAVPSARVIWERFPKFVLGFIVASIVFSFMLPADVVAGTRSALSELRVWWFAMAFVCIGLETRFVELASTDQGRRNSPGFPLFV